MIGSAVLLKEQEFFDREAADLRDDDLFIPADQVERYRHARLGPMNIPKDRPLFAHLSPLEGKRVLDYCCGHGENACLLAACGAEVTAFDLSPVSLAKAHRRAELLGVADRIQFENRVAGETGYPPSHFDAVIGFAALHHLHMDLSTVFEEIIRLLKPGGTACFVEPLADSLVLRVVRRITPVKRYATADERQLTYKDLEPLRRYFSSVEIKHFYFLERLERIVGRWASRPLRRIDHSIQQVLPFLNRLYGDVLIVAR